MAHLRDEHVAAVDRNLPPRARGSDERRRTRTVNQIDHNGIVIHRLELKRNLIRIASDRRGVYDNVITLSTKIAQGNVRQSQQRRGMLTALGSSVDERYAGARFHQCRGNRPSGAATADDRSLFLFYFDTAFATGGVNHIGIRRIGDPPTIVSDKYIR